MSGIFLGTVFPKDSGLTALYQSTLKVTEPILIWGYPAPQTNATSGCGVFTNLVTSPKILLRRNSSVTQI